MAEPRVTPLVETAIALDGRCVEAHGLPLAHANGHHHLPLRPAPALTRVVEVPGTGHAHVGVQHDPVVPGELEVLAEALDLLDDPTHLWLDAVKVPGVE